MFVACCIPVVACLVGLLIMVAWSGRVVHGKVQASWNLVKTRLHSADLAAPWSNPDFESFVQSFAAHDPLYQSWCVGALMNGTPFRGGGAQCSQDVYMFRNLFFEQARRGRRGFYVESGTNEWFSDSNTFFFDKCLGWDGLCVEPQAAYHSGIKAGRSCKLVPECIASAVGMRSFVEGGGFGHVGQGEKNEKTFKVLCRPLDYMLEDMNRTHVDLWSLDIEGLEFEVLESVAWTRLSFTSVLIEDHHLDPRRLDYWMTVHGFSKFQQLRLDSLYVARHHQTLYPPNWPEGVIGVEQYGRS